MKNVSVEELQQMRDRGERMTLINVLSEEDFHQAHIPDSENVPVHRDDFVARVEKMVRDKDEKVVVYCACLDCDASPTAAKKLEEAGFSDVYEFAGGLKEWLTAGLGVARPAAKNP